MSPTADMLFLFSLCLNGIWLAKIIIRWAGDNSMRLVRATLTLFGLTVPIGFGVLVLHLSGSWFVVAKAVNGVVFPACLWCCVPLMELLPRPWGNAPEKKGKLR